MSQIHMQVNNLIQWDISIWGHPYFSEKRDRNSGLRITSILYICLEGKLLKPL